MREIRVVRLIPMRAAAPLGACYAPVCDFQDADRLIAFISFARPSHWSGPAIVAQFPNRSLQRRAVGKDHRTLDEILQLTNVPRPMPTRELPHGRGGNRFDLFVHSAAVLLDEVAGQQGNVLRAFTQRRDADRKHIQAAYKSLRNSRFSIIFSRSRWVAATSRTSTFLVRVLPSRSNSRSCKARSNLG